MQKFASTLKFSKQFLLLNLSLLLGSMAIIFYLSFGIILKGLLLIFVLIYGFFILRQSQPWHTIRHDNSGWWLDEFNIDILGESTVTAHVTILRFVISPGRRKQTCIIFKDAMTGDQYRQFVVRLRKFQ